MSEKSRLLDTLFCVFLGFVGVHRFYEGKIAWGIVWACTLGLCLIGWLTDIFLVLFGWSVDVNGCKIKIWRPHKNASAKERSEKGNGTGSSGENGNV